MSNIKLESSKEDIIVRKGCKKAVAEEAKGLKNVKWASYVCCTGIPSNVQAFIWLAGQANISVKNFLLKRGIKLEN